MQFHLMTAAVLFLSSVTGEAAMTSQTIDADILDERVLRCGVTIEENSLTMIRPFIETSPEMRGQISIRVQSKSGSNSNISVQTVSFPGNNLIGIGHPTSALIEMTATADGKELCRLSKTIDFAGAGIRI